MFSLDEAMRQCRSINRDLARTRECTGCSFAEAITPTSRLACENKDLPHGLAEIPCPGKTVRRKEQKNE